MDIIENTPMETKSFIIPFTEVKAGDENNEAGRFSGYGSVFGNVDLGGDIVSPGAFAKSLNEWSRKGQLPAMYGFHNSTNPIGDWLVMREDEKGLFVEGQLWVKAESRIEQAIVAHNIMKGTGPKGLSIGYRVREFEDTETSQGTIRTLKEVDLMEVSVVGFAMNPLADVTAVKSLTDTEGDIVSKREAEKILRDAGLSKKQSKAFIAGGYDALKRDAKELVIAEGRDDSLDLSKLLKEVQTISTILEDKRV